MRTYSCEPTLNDTQVIGFCKRGFLMLEGVVPDEINQRTLEFAHEHPTLQLTEILEEEWFVDNVILHPQAAGAMRSLLGEDFRLPNIMYNHRTECPQPAQEWHTDGGSKYGPELHYLQVFYSPQECPREMGPTELLPGSHFLFALRTYMSHYGNIRGSNHAVAPAGSILITAYNIWHRRSASTGTGIRNLLKYNYWRSAPPRRDWIIEPDFDVAHADFSVGGFKSLKHPTFRQQFRDCRDAAGMYAWLCGKYDNFHLMGGQGWPTQPPHEWLDKPYGVPAGLLDD